MSDYFLDFNILTASFCGFAFFLFVHIPVLRYTSVTMTARLMFSCFVLGAFVAAALLLLLLGRNPVAMECGGSFFIVSFFLSLVIFCLLVFNYLAWFYGMATAAIRINLLQLLIEMPGRQATKKQILEQCNAQSILRIRLIRLAGSGHLIIRGDAYVLRSRVLLVQRAITRIMRALLGLS
jgi:hypothetical protein